MIGYEVKQSQTAQPLLFLMVLASDHLSPATGKSPTVTLSKNGGAFAGPAGAVTEVGSGWYKVAGNGTDTNTLGPLILHATEASSDPTDTIFPVVSYDPQDAIRLGLGALPAVTVNQQGGLVGMGVRAATAQAGSTTNTIVLDAGSSAANNLWNGLMVSIISGTGSGQSRTVIAYDNTTKIATVDRPWVTIPDGTSAFVLSKADQPSLGADLGVILADGVAHGGTPGASTATMAFSRMVGQSQSANTAAMSLTGNGTGPGALYAGGATGQGATFNGGATSGHGVSMNGVGGNAAGLNIAGLGAQPGLVCAGGAASGHGASFSAGGGFGHGAVFNGVGAGSGIQATGGGSNGIGISALAGAGSGAGFRALGGGALGPGILAQGANAVGSNPGGVGIAAVGGTATTSAGGVAGFGLQVTGGAGAASTNGAAPGASFAGGGTNTVASAAHGFVVSGTSNGDGISAIGAGTGVGERSAPAAVGFGSGGGGTDTPGTTTLLTRLPQAILFDGSGYVQTNAVVVGDKTGYSLTQAFPTNFAALVVTAGGAVTTGDVLATALARFFTLSSGTTYAAAVAGSVVKEIVTNTSGGSGGSTAADIWSYANRTLTAPINFAALAIDTGGRIKVQTGITRAAPIPNFEFAMLDANNNPIPGLMVTAQRSLDGASPAPCANAVVAIGSGLYKINLASSDTDAGVFTLIFSATGVPPRFLTFVTTT